VPLAGGTAGVWGRLREQFQPCDHKNAGGPAGGPALTAASWCDPCDPWFNGAPRRDGATARPEDSDLPGKATGA
jgi:hypothetical protein